MRVNKSLKIFSTNGAGATLLLAPPSLSLSSVVSLESAGAELGKSNKGFTLVGATGTAVTCDSVSNVKIVGNRIAATSFYSGIEMQSCDSAVVAKNVVTGDVADFGIYLNDSPAAVTGNVVTGAGTGLALSGTGITATGNVATRNGFGMDIYMSAPALGPPAKFDKNSMIGNFGAGLVLYAEDNPTGGLTVALGRSNVFANADYFNANCGVVVGNDDTTDPLTVNATGFFWGTASGPGVNPADAFGGACNGGAGAVTSSAPSPAAKPVSIKAPAQR